MMLGVLRSNRENVLNALSGLQDQLTQIKSALADEDDLRLEAVLDQSRSTYQHLTSN